MKKVLLLLSCLSVLLLFNACNKDEELGLSDPAEQKSENLHPHVHGKRTCASVQHTHKLMQNPEYKRLHELKFEKLASVASSRAACNNPVVLPVAVHFQGVSNPDVACLRDLAATQIAILNADYSGTNSDISNWVNNAASSFPGINYGEACLEFCLASQSHPSGYGLSNGDPAVTVNQTTGDSNSDWSGYINIFVQPNTGVLGYSPLGGSGNGDGVVIDASAFGSGAGCGNISPQAPFNLGRTLTHEMGHYLLLDHIWGNGGCGSDDGVNDTPVSSQPYYDCPQVGASSCSSTDLHMDYMDYTNDACMYMFTAGQATRMENYVSSSLQNVVNNASSVCSGGGGGGPTCSDGIQNGQETGVDCGGPDCAPCEGGPTCSDGIQNGQETGVDCGGPDCAPCEGGPTCSDGIQNGQETGVDCGGPDCEPCQTDACTTPDNVQAIVLGPTEAEVSWDAVAAANRYRFRYREQGTNAWNASNTTNTIIFLSGLRPQTTYEYQVRTICTGERSPWTRRATFTTDGGGGACPGEEVNLSLILDDYGSETTWELLDGSFNLVASGGPYQDGQSGQEINESWCLEDDCYLFVLYDDYGDGICCDYGQGSFELTDGNGNLLAASDGRFGYYEFVEFCISGTAARQTTAHRAPKVANSRSKASGKISAAAKAKVKAEMRKVARQRSANR